MKPMLAGKADLSKLSYPILCSPKLDGVRCLILGGKPVSRNLKPIPNMGVQSILQGLPQFDGELIVGPPAAPDAFNVTSSGVMSTGGFPDFTFWVFDVVTVKPYPFEERLKMAMQFADASGNCVQFVDHQLIQDEAGLLKYESKVLGLGYEGVMLRAPDGPYKYGRSTPKEGYLLKLKRFEDSEARVIGFEEKEHNDNELTTDALGRAKRTSHKANKRGAGTLGSLTVEDVATGVRFSIGSGFNEVERADIWRARGGSGSLLGSVVKYRFQPTGVKSKPRFPTYLGVRHAQDT